MKGVISEAIYKSTIVKMANVHRIYESIISLKTELVGFEPVVTFFPLGLG